MQAFIAEVFMRRTNVRVASVTDCNKDALAGGADLRGIWQG
jgi:hypothetical protein